MKFLFFSLVLFFFSASLVAQADFTRIDSIARSVKKTEFKTAEALAKHLCTDLKTDLEKARALFTWIAINTRYDLEKSEKVTSRSKTTDEEIEESVERTFKKGKGVCMDYSLLYLKMANSVGLECEYITGNATDPLGTGWHSHSWNVVKIGGKWQLLDATWGAGYVDEETWKFRAKFQPGFFMPSPRLFVLHHFPDEEEWQLLDEPVSKKEFKSQPSVIYATENWTITDAEPLDKILPEAENGQFEIRLKTLNPPKFIWLEAAGKKSIVEQKQENGWLILRFEQPKGREIRFWAGEKPTGKVSLLGVFYLK